jgi:hypothetical protein
VRFATPPVDFIVKKKKVTISGQLWDALEGPKPDPATFTESDGCSKSPDIWGTIGGKRFKLWPACVIHDYHYRTGVLGGTWASRARADAILRGNVRQLVLLQGGTQTQALRIGWTYWAGVRIASAFAFCFDEGEEPLSLWSRIREVLGLFLAKPGAYRPTEGCSVDRPAS